MKKIFNKQNKFLFALVGMILLARILPYRDEYNAVFNLNRFIDWGICIIFLLYGLKLNIKEVFAGYKELETPLIGTARYLCPLSAFGSFVLPLCQGYRLPIDLALYFLFSELALYGILLGSDGFYCQRQYYLGYIQRLHIGTDRDCSYTPSHGLFLRKHLGRGRSRRNYSAVITQSTASYCTGAIIESPFEEMGR